MRTGFGEGRRWRLVAPAVLLVVAGLFVGATSPAPVKSARQVVTEDGRAYDAYVPAALKHGQYYQYTCEFDAAWAVLATFGHDVPFEEQLEIVGHDTSIEPYYQETPTGFVIYGGDITSAFSGDYTHNLLARTTGRAMRPLFEHFGLVARPVRSKQAIQSTLDRGGLVWIKASVDFLPWVPTTWITPDDTELPTVLGNDHAVVVMGYDANVAVIRDVLGPTDTNWGRPYEYEVPWQTFLAVWEAQGNDGLATFPSDLAEDEDADTDQFVEPVEVTGSA